MDIQKNDVPNDIFIQWHENPLYRGREKTLKMFSQGRKNPAENQPFHWSRQTTKQVFSAGKCFLG